MEKRKIYTITEITKLIKNTIEPKFSEVWLTGEISNYKTYSSGHMYFSLKDETAQINAVIFYPNTLNIKFQLEDGLKVIAFGRISVYAKRGEYRIVVLYIEPIGKGALQLAFEQLKEKLAKEGLFDFSRKKPIPKLIEKIGVVTSPDGAAIKDILTTLKRTSTNIEVLIFPVRVQGDEAKYDISFAIDYLNKNYSDYLDVLLVGRGGGSIEDLWPFNEEIVARAISNSKIPVISCVGHEIDYTIADFVADYRSPTPTAAAEFIAKNRKELKDNIENMKEKILKQLTYKFENLSIKFSSLMRSPVFTRPLTFVEEKYQELDDLYVTLCSSFRHITEIKQKDLTILTEKLNTLSPLNILKRGYSIVYDVLENKIVKDAHKLKLGSLLKIRFHKGKADSKVEKIYD